MSRKTIVFDVGGVIVRWHPTHLVREHLPSVAHDDASARHVVAQVFQGWDANADWVAFDLGRVEPDELVKRIAARTGYSMAALASLVGAIPEHLQPMRESVALIERARGAGRRLALISNMPRPFADHLEAHHVCFQAFELRAWSGRLGMMKPERAIFEHLRTSLALDLDHTIFVDDHVANVEAARAYGWQALQFECAAQCEVALAAGGWL
jgi:putative hydrolase of the HAD superfamily